MNGNSCFLFWISEHKVCLIRYILNMSSKDNDVIIHSFSDLLMLTVCVRLSL